MRYHKKKLITFITFVVLTFVSSLFAMFVEPLVGFGFTILFIMIGLTFILDKYNKLVMSNRINEKDVAISYYRGQGPGGQHRNKTENACKVIHLPTGITVCVDARKRTESRRKALHDLNIKVNEFVEQKRKEASKQRRDDAIRNELVVRTYNIKRGTVKDHNTGKEAPVKEVLYKGRIDLLKGN